MRAAAESRDERGETLLELIVAIAILGVCVVAIASGIAVSVVASRSHRDQATAGTYLHNYAEQLSSAYTCGGSVPAPNASIQQVGFSNTPSVAVTYWNGTTFAGTSCSAASDPGLAQMKITVKSLDNRVSESLVLVVRKP